MSASICSRTPLTFVWGLREAPNNPVCLLRFKELIACEYKNVCKDKISGSPSKRRAIKNGRREWKQQIQFIYTQPGNSTPPPMEQRIMENFRKLWAFKDDIICIWGNIGSYLSNYSSGRVGSQDWALKSQSLPTLMTMGYTCKIQHP